MTETAVKTFYPGNKEQWREWLQEHHENEKSVWLVFYKNKSGNPTITWSDAVDEALCFGWIDSIAKPVDDEKFVRFFSKRKTNSAWSAVNKEKVQRLIASGLMTKAGFNSIETAKQNGSWALLDEVEALSIPMDLEQEFEKRPTAKSYFESLSKSDKKNILQWIVLAKRAETRQKRLTEIAELAEQNLKPKAIQWKKKPAND